MSVSFHDQGFELRVASASSSSSSSSCGGCSLLVPRLFACISPAGCTHARLDGKLLLSLAKADASQPAWCVRLSPAPCVETRERDARETKE